MFEGVIAVRGRYQKPDGERVRRNATIATTRLPAEGRTGRTPVWPLGPDIVTAAKLRVAELKVEDLESKAEESAAKSRAVEAALTRARERVHVLRHVVDIQLGAERALWKQLWHMPQATMWEREQAHREVASYVRWQVLAENGDVKAATEARQRSDRLGLTPQSMLRLRWSVADDEVGAARQAAADTSAAAVPSRPHLKAVDPDAVAGS